MSSVSLFDYLGGDCLCDSPGNSEDTDFDIKKQCLKNPAGLEFVEIEHIRREGVYTHFLSNYYPVFALY